VKENLEVVRSLHPGIEQKAISDIIEILGLSQYADKRAGHLSLGNVQRLGLAKAFLHQPKVLFLDEPSNGLDPAGIVEIREYLRDLASEQGATIFMSSHLLGEVSKVAHRVGIIHQGRLLQEMKVGELQQQQSRRLVVRTRANDRAKRLLADAGIASSLVGQEDSIQNLLINDGNFLEYPDKIASILVAGDAPPTHLVVEEEELEEYFLRLVGQEKPLTTSTTSGRE
jgi:ABC-2 type transport system ATP-binding protein